MSREVVIHAPDGSTRRLPLEGERLQLGRSHDNDVSYPDDVSLSRRHLLLEKDGADWIVQDLGSKNRTLVNGVQVTGRHRLKAGDRISAGHLLLIFDAQGKESSHQSVIFYPDTGDDSSFSGTVMTNLEGILSKEATVPGTKRPGPGSEPAVRKKPVNHPAVSALLRAGRELVGHRPLQELFELILDLSIEAVGAERGVLMLREQDQLEVQAVRGEGFRISSAVRDRVLAEKTSLLVRDTQQDEAFRMRQSINEQNIRTMMAVPLQTQDRVIGLIHVDSRFFVREFTSDDLDLLTVLGNVAAIRIEQERLVQVEQAERIMARELEQAGEIQQRLLAGHVPEVEGYELVGFNVPCRTIGGDYYEFFKNRDGRITIVLGDVSGKGMAAALLASSLQSRVQVLAEDPDPLSATVGRLDRLMATNCPNNRFVTLFIAIIDPESGEMTYCNAGHNPPLLVRADGSVEKLSGGGTVLGILPDVGYNEKSCRLGPGDIVTVYSDGFTEAMNAEGEEFGEERLGEAIREGRELDADRITQRLKDAVTDWTGGARPEDDMTLVVVRRTP